MLLHSKNYNFFQLYTRSAALISQVPSCYTKAKCFRNKAWISYAVTTPVIISTQQQNCSSQTGMLQSTNKT